MPFNLPPGLKHSLPFYLHKPWVRLGRPILLFEHLHRTYGPIARYRFMGTDIIFLNHPDYIREVLINQAPSFIKERTLKRMKILLGEGLITSDDPIHMRQRKIAAPAFHRQRIAAYGDKIVAIASAWADRHAPGAVVDMNAAMMELSLEIIARTLFDLEVTPDIRAINDEVNTIMGIYNFLVAMPRLESWLHWPVPILNRFRRARARLNTTVDAIITARRVEIAANPSADRGDLLSMLLASRYEDDPTSSQGMSDTQIRDEVLTIFLAGYETVANALTWTWYCLSQNPAADALLHAELTHVLAPCPSREKELSLRPESAHFADVAEKPATCASAKNCHPERSEGPASPPSPENCHPERSEGPAPASSAKKCHPERSEGPASPPCPENCHPERSEGPASASSAKNCHPERSEGPASPPCPENCHPGRSEGPAPASSAKNCHPERSEGPASPPCPENCHPERSEGPASASSAKNCHPERSEGPASVPEALSSTPHPLLPAPRSPRLPTLADYPSLPITEQTFAEAMRLYPPAWAMGRQSTRDVTLGPYTIPAGAHFFFSQYVMHRSAEFFPDPLRFDPSRHTPEAKAGRDKFVYFPFGGGGRQCIGESFAWMEGVLAIATIASRWRFTYLGDTPPVPQARITLRPRDPVLMRLTPR